VHITTGSTSRRSKPTDDQLDVYGLTHQGKVRAQNQDHFLVRQLKKQMEVLHTSLPNVSVIPADQERLAMVAMVGGGGASWGRRSQSRCCQGSHPISGREHSRLLNRKHC